MFLNFSTTNFNDQQNFTTKVSVVFLNVDLLEMGEE